MSRPSYAARSAEVILGEAAELSPDQVDRLVLDISKSRDAATRSCHVVLLFLMVCLVLISANVVYGEKQFKAFNSELNLDYHRVFFLFVVGNLFYAIHLGSFFRVVVAEKVLYGLIARSGPNQSYKSMYYGHFSTIILAIHDRLIKRAPNWKGRMFRLCGIYAKYVGMMIYSFYYYAVLICFLYFLATGSYLIPSLNDGPLATASSGFTVPYAHWVYFVVLIALNGVTYLASFLLLRDLDPFPAAGPAAADRAGPPVPANSDAPPPEQVA